MERVKEIEELENAIRRLTPRSAAMRKRAFEVLPDGDISAARKFAPYPFYAAGGDGAYIWDIDDNRYLDCCMVFGVALLGHRPPSVMKAVAEQIENGPLHYGSPFPGEVEWAEKFTRCVPCAERVVLCNTGNEAVQKAVNIARAYTGKDKVAKVEGGFHGSNEYSLWSVVTHPKFMGPAERPNAVPMAPGMPAAAADNMLVLPFGDEAAFDLIEEHASELAVVMTEPVHGPGALTAGADYLRKLREVTKRNGVLLLFDEVITGFRLALGGGQELFDVVPDIGLFGKALGGGTAIGAIGCSKEILDHVMDLTPPLLVAGTFSGNALTLAASNAFLDHMIANSPQLQNKLSERGDYLRSGFNDFARSRGLPATMTGLGSMWQLCMADAPIEKPRDLIKVDEEALHEFELRLRLKGVFLAAHVHIAFLSEAHSDENVEQILTALTESLEETFTGRSN